MPRLARALRFVRLVKYSGAGLVLAFFIWDFLAHLTNLMYLGFEWGLKFGYGTPNYELTASLVLGIGVVITMLTLLSYGVELIIVELIERKPDA